MLDRSLEAEFESYRKTLPTDEARRPQFGAFLPAALMYFLSGKPRYFYSGVDTRPAMGILLTRRAHAEERDASGRER